MKKYDNCNLPVPARYVGALPDIVTAKQGHRFDPHQDTSALRELTHEVRLRFDKMPYLGRDFNAAFKAVLVWYAQYHSIGYVRSQYTCVRRLLEHKAETSGTHIVELSS